jgi:hypothetical protein
MVRFGVEQELVNVRIHEALKTVRRLAKGRTEAAERPPVRPVTHEAAIPVADLAGDDPISASHRLPTRGGVSGSTPRYRRVGSRLVVHSMLTQD